MAKICLNCGKQLKENDSFCSKCGKKVKDKTVNIKSNINELKTTQKLDQHFRHTQYTIKDFVDLNDIIANIILLFFTLGIGNIFYIAYKIYEYKYFSSQEFLEIKNNISKYTQECNELNYHIENLKNSYCEFQQIDYGQAYYIDNSRYSYKRPKLKNINNYNYNVYNCSLAVCKNAQQQPFKYICKYFNIPINEETLSKFETVLNNFSAVEQGKFLLKAQRDKIVDSVKDNIPFIIKSFSKKRMVRFLGFKDIDLTQLYFPKYVFKYVSAGGNANMNCTIIMNIDNLNKFIIFLSEKIKFKKSIAGQRALMTSSLREKIKQRDNYTCQHCGISNKDEPNLLLEIDHIIPLAKNGLTTENNLQTLCWKCNRSKGSKIL